MKKVLSLNRYMSVSFLIVLSAFPPALWAQICQNPLDSVYSMNTTGTLYPLNVNNAQAGTAIAASGTAVSSNGVGFSTLDGKFYFFNITGTGAAPSPQFVSYNPVTAALTVLPSPPATIGITQRIRTGCVNNLGSGYFTLNPASGGTSTPALYYYNIATLTWTTVTTSFLSPAMVSLNATFNNLNSGDMAFDGSGNLWILLSSTANYALYKIAGPVPTTPTASVTAVQIIGTTPLPSPGVAITGIAFNAAGTMYLTTGSGSNLLYRITTVAAGLTLIGTLPVNDMGADLTSCTAPLSVLPTASLQHFNAVLKKDAIELSWTANEDISTKGYNVQHSKDGLHWTTIAVVDCKYVQPGTGVSYKYADNRFSAENNYYRIVQTTLNGKENSSATKLINASKQQTVVIGPNPASDIIYVYNTANEYKYLCQIFDRTGKLIQTNTIAGDKQYVNIDRLPKGSYVLKLSSAVNKVFSTSQFVKW